MAGVEGEGRRGGQRTSQETGQEQSSALAERIKWLKYYMQEAGLGYGIGSKLAAADIRPDDIASMEDARFYRIHGIGRRSVNLIREVFPFERAPQPSAPTGQRQPQQEVGEIFPFSFSSSASVEAVRGYYEMQTRLRKIREHVESDPAFQEIMREDRRKYKRYNRQRRKEKR